MKKKLYFHLVFMLFCTLAFGQNLKPGDYIQSPENLKFVGKWRGVSGQYQLTLTLQNHEKIYLKSIDIYMDNIEGSVLLTKNGEMLIGNEHTISGGLTTPDSPYTLNAHFNDGANGAGGRIAITFPDKNNLDKILLTFTPHNYGNLKFKDPVKPGRLPKTITLVRVPG